MAAVPVVCQDPRMWESIRDPRVLERTAAVESEDVAPKLERLRGGWKAARWLAAALLLLAGVAGIVISGWTVCEDRLAAVGGQAVVRVCRPPALIDLPVVATLAIALLLLLPDMVEIGIPGFISLKRRVEDQEAKLAGLELQMAQSVDVRQSAVQEADSRALALNVNLLDVQGALREFQDKAGEEISSMHMLSQGRVTPRRGQLEGQLLRAWAQLQPLVESSEFALNDETRIHDAQLRVHWAESLYQMSQHDRQLAQREMRSNRPQEVELGKQEFARSESETLETAERLREARAHLERLIAKSKPPVRGQLTNEQLAALRKWRIDFSQEVSIVETAQRAVAQAEPIDDEKLVAAVRLAEGLLAAWDSRQAVVSETDHDRQATGRQQSPST